MNAFFDELNRQRWDDHRFYHHCRINQSLHLFSACCFVIAYLLLPFEPAWSAIIAWCLSMTSRQAGHFFFEPRGFDEVNQVTDEYKEAVKVGYNIRRKIVLMSIWVACPVALIINPSLGGLIEPVRLTENVAIYVNEGGILLGLPMNTVLRNSEGRAVFSLVGDLFVGANDEEGDSRSLTDDEVSLALRLLGAK